MKGDTAKQNERAIPIQVTGLTVGERAELIEVLEKFNDANSIRMPLSAYVGKLIKMHLKEQREGTVRKEHPRGG